MSCKRNEHRPKVCPGTGHRLGYWSRSRWPLWLLPVLGLASLIWFLIRVIPKPSRAAYPCQRLVAPFASAFVVWLTGLVGSTLLWRRARRLLGQSRYVTAGMFLAAAVSVMWLSLHVAGERETQAAFVPSEPSNQPIGVGKGIYPGRVVWTHDPAAANWDERTGRWWSDENTDQAVVDSMVSRSIRALTGEPNDVAAWDALFRHFNAVRGLGDIGYQPGEKIAIKINMNQDSGGAWGMRSGMPSPQALHSLLDQLIRVAGVPGEAITLYDASRFIGDPLYDKVRGDPDPDFQAVRFVVRPDLARAGRIAAVDDSTVPVCFAHPAIYGGATAYLPQCVTEAKYLINMALLRAHSLFGITVCAKNHFGSIRFPTWSGNRGWTPEPLHNYGSRTGAMGTYNCLVDLMGHAHLGGKTLLVLIDGLYSARNQSAEVMKYQSFGDNWCASLFLSQDPVAIDSVALDFIRNEPRATDCTGQGVDNYLHEAALAHDPPSGTFYDPDGDGIRLASLGVHEHWNNAIDRQYSRNLGAEEGIELVTPALTSENGPVLNATKGTRYDAIRHAVQDADDGDTIVVPPGRYRETVDFADKNVTVRSEDPNDPMVVAATVIAGNIRSVVFANGQGRDCVLAGLTLTGAVQGVYCTMSSPTLINCRIVDNDEAGVKLGESSDPMLVNCVIAGNGGSGIEMWAPRGGRMIPYNAAMIVHCTIVGNGTEGVAGDKPAIVNSVLYGNGPAGNVPQVTGDLPTVNYSNVQGGFPGTGNIDVEPGFVTPGYWSRLPSGVEVWIHGDYHLRADSPCIDAGDPDFVVEVPTDIDGDPRISGPRPDLGCDEVP